MYTHIHKHLCFLLPLVLALISMYTVLAGFSYFFKYSLSCKTSKNRYSSLGNFDFILYINIHETANFPHSQQSPTEMAKQAD